MDTFIILEKRYPNKTIVSEAILQIGLGYFNLNKTKLAKQYLKKSIKILSVPEKISMASLYLGNIYYQEGQMKEAVDFYSKAKKTENPSLTAEATYRLAESLFSLGKHEKALKELNSLVFSSPDQLLWVQMARFRLGNFYEQKGDTELALRFYSQVINMKNGTKDLVQAAQDRSNTIRNIKDMSQEGKK